MQLTIDRICFNYKHRVRQLDWERSRLNSVDTGGMRAVLLIGCLLLVTVAGDVEKRQEEPSDAAKDVAAGAVVDLTDDNFDELIANHAVWMVDVYAPW